MYLHRFFRLNINTKDRIFGLDLLRTAAILLVILGHGDYLLRENFPNFISFWIVDGVDFFFVLSGFLIGSILIRTFDNKNISFGLIFEFWKKRWFRTIPNYYLIIFLCCVYVFMTERNFGEYSFSYLIFTQNFIKSHPAFLPVAWSLAVEEWFYILFPFTIYLLCSVFSRISKKKIIILAIVLFIILPLLYRIKKGLFFYEGEHPLYIWDTVFRKTVLTRLDSIVFGVLGSYINFYYYYFWNRFKKIKFIIGCTLLFLVQQKIKSGILYYTVFFDLNAIGILFLLPLLSNIKEVDKRISKPITFLSIISYSMYLIHMSLIIDPICKFGKYPFTKTMSVVYYLTYLILTVLFSTIIYKYFEKPTTDLRDKF